MLRLIRSYCLTTVKQLNKSDRPISSNVNFAMSSRNVTTIESHVLGKVLVESQTNPEHTATVIFLHGSGDTGPGVKSWLELALGTSIAFAHIQLMFPTAPEQPYTPLMGEKSHVWFDRKAIQSTSKECKKSVDLMAQKIYTFIEDELVAKGTPYDRIIIGGFSMGGAMALHVVYRYCPQLAGVFTLSSFLNYDSLVYEDLRTRRSLAIDSDLPPLFSCHGDRDELVTLEEGEQTYLNLTAIGVRGQFHTIEGMHHELRKRELVMLYNWIRDILKDEDYSKTQEESDS